MGSYGQRLTFGEAVSSVFSKYATFQGRAPRSEYWWFILFMVIAQFVASLLDGLMLSPFHLVQYGEGQGLSPISTLVNLGLLIPSISVGVRRFHDLGRTGWWMLIMLTGIGAMVVFFWFMARGDEGPNRYGRDPLDRRPV